MIFTIPRDKAERLVNELTMTTRQDELKNLQIALSMTEGDISINKFSPEGMNLYLAFRFFDDVGMLG